MLTRTEVYSILDKERDKQDAFWGGVDHDRRHELGSWLTYMRVYLRKAEDAISTSKCNDELALDNLCKVVALGVACMEYLYDLEGTV